MRKSAKRSPKRRSASRSASSSEMKTTGSRAQVMNRNAVKTPGGLKRKDFRGSKAEGGLMEATARLKRQGLLRGGVARGCGRILSNRKKVTKVF